MISRHKQAAEKSARQYLEMRGFKLLESNFKRSKYEIDLIALKNEAVYFMAIYLVGDEHSSIDMVAPSNLNKAMLAGASWIEENKWSGQIHHSAIELDQHTFAVLNLIEDIV